MDAGSVEKCSKLLVYVISPFLFYLPAKVRLWKFARKKLISINHSSEETPVFPVLGPENLIALYLAEGTPLPVRNREIQAWEKSECTLGIFDVRLPTIHCFYFFIRKNFI